MLLVVALVVLGGVNIGLLVVVLVLGLLDPDNVGHDLASAFDADFGTLHDLDFETEDTLAEFDVTDSDIDELFLGLTGGDLVTLSVLLGLSTLTTHLTRDDNLTTGGTTTTHNSSHNVVGSHTDWNTIKKLEFKSLDVSGSREVLVEGEGLNRELNLVVLIVEVVSLLNEGLDLLNLTGLGVEEGLVVSSLNTDFSAHVSNTDLNTGVAVHTESTGEQFVKLSLENTVSNELLLSVHFLYLLVSQTL